MIRVDKRVKMANFLFVILFCLIWVSCQKASEAFLPKEKVIILYLVGENNLYSYADGLLDDL